MKNLTTLFIGILIFAGLLFATVACNETDDPNVDGQNTEKLKDIEGNEYKTVKIGSQIWMAENLKTTRYNDGTKIPNVTDGYDWMELITGAYCNYENQESNATTYGRLYNWYAVNTGKLAPAGWHVATYEDWDTLLGYVKANTGTSGSESKALAAAINWASANNAGDIGNDLVKNNITGFSALPSGYRTSGGGGKPAALFYHIGRNCAWWIIGDLNYPFSVSLYTGSSIVEVEGSYSNQTGGYSVRCVRDN